MIGDLFQQFATKFLGIGRAIPLSNTNQMWGLAWGALVFGELAHADRTHWMLVVFGSIVMILGALAVSTAVANEKERASMREAVVRECARYDLDYDRISELHTGARPMLANGCRAWWDYVIVAGAIAVFIWSRSQRPGSCPQHELRLDRGAERASARLCRGRRMGSVESNPLRLNED